MTQDADSLDHNAIRLHPVDATTRTAIRAMDHRETTVGCFATVVNIVFLGTWGTS